jgi:hypothetical protein
VVSRRDGGDVANGPAIWRQREDVRITLREGDIAGARVVEGRYHVASRGARRQAADGQASARDSDRVLVAVPAVNVAVAAPIPESSRRP